MTGAVHVFAVIMAISGQTIDVDLYSHTFNTMQQCREYAKINHDEIVAAVARLRPLYTIPDGSTFEVRYGCRGIITDISSRDKYTDWCAHIKQNYCR
jgi:hypothetical protein